MPSISGDGGLSREFAEDQCLAEGQCVLSALKGTTSIHLFGAGYTAMTCRTALGPPFKAGQWLAVKVGVEDVWTPYRIEAVSGVSHAVLTLVK
ncbi:MAG TPA: hypothetical protein PKI27_03590 [Dermatophilaceae bacterium]|nr:hypothetical protein [Dermatophilaceae bacterium]